MAFAEPILWIAFTYGVIGLLFALGFVTAGVGRVDAAARRAPIGFRLLILPGSLALWPVLLRKWMSATRRQT